MGRIEAALFVSQLDDGWVTSQTCHRNSDYLNSHFDQYVFNHATIGIGGLYMREENIIRYDLPVGFMDYNDITMPGDEKKLLETIRANDTGLFRESVSLREAAFAIENGWSKDKSYRSASRQIELNRNEPNYTERFKSYCDFLDHWQNNREHCIITAIQTDKGVHLFDESGYGRLARQAYLNYLSNNYYNPELEGLTFLKYYSFESSDKNLIDKGRESYKLLSPYKAEYVPSKHFPSSIVKGLEPAIECDMVPRYGYLIDFADAFKLEISSKNKNILLLSKIAADGYDPKLFEKGERIRSDRHKMSFEGIDQRYKQNGSIHEAYNHISLQAVHRDARIIAEHILKNEYKARGYMEPVKKEKKVSINNNKIR